MYIRKLLDDEYEDVVQLITDTVHFVCKKDYSEKELDAWAPPKFDVNKFRFSLSSSYNLVAFMGKRLVGFISVEENGYINRLYTHKDYQGCGIATALLKRAEKWAVENGILLLTLDSSKTAESFYIKRGFEKAGVSVTNHKDVVFRSSVMKKHLKED